MSLYPPRRRRRRRNRVSRAMNKFGGAGVDDHGNYGTYNVCYPGYDLTGRAVVRKIHCTLQRGATPREEGLFLPRHAASRRNFYKF